MLYSYVWHVACEYAIISLFSPSYPSLAQSYPSFDHHTPHFTTIPLFSPSSPSSALQYRSFQRCRPLTTQHGYFLQLTAHSRTPPTFQQPPLTVVFQTVVSIVQSGLPILLYLPWGTPSPATPVVTSWVHPVPWLILCAKLRLFKKSSSTATLAAPWRYA